MRQCLLFLAGFFCLATAYGQDLATPQQGPALTGFVFEQKDVKPGFLGITKQYTDSSLWGFMNGGADLYQEYGVVSLIHQEIVFRGALFKADIYEMKDSAAAFGIYSVSVLNCKTRDSITSFACLNPYQVQFTSGRYYVSITNIRGDSISGPSGIDLAQRLLRKVFQRPFLPPAIFQTRLLLMYQQYIKVIYGPLGLQNGYPDWSDRFENMQGYYITMLPLNEPQGNIAFARIIFGNTGDMDAFRNRIGLADAVNPSYWKQTTGEKTMELIKLDEVSCYFVESRGNHRLAKDLLDSIDQVGKKAGGQ